MVIYHRGERRKIVAHQLRCLPIFLDEYRFFLPGQCTTTSHLILLPQVLSQGHLDVVEDLWRSWSGVTSIDDYRQILLDEASRAMFAAESLVVSKHIVTLLSLVEDSTKVERRGGGPAAPFERPGPDEGAEQSGVELSTAPSTGSWTPGTERGRGAPGFGSDHGMNEALEQLGSSAGVEGATSFVPLSPAQRRKLDSLREWVQLCQKLNELLRTRGGLRFVVENLKENVRGAATEAFRELKKHAPLANAAKELGKELGKKTANKVKDKVQGVLGLGRWLLGEDVDEEEQSVEDYSPTISGALAEIAARGRASIAGSPSASSSAAAPPPARPAPRPGGGPVAPSPAAASSSQLFSPSVPPSLRRKSSVFRQTSSTAAEQRASIAEDEQPNPDDFPVQTPLQLRMQLQKSRYGVFEMLIQFNPSVVLSHEQLLLSFCETLGLDAMNNVDMLLLLASAYTLLGRFDRALEHLQRGVVKVKGNMLVAAERAVAEREMLGSAGAVGAGAKAMEVEDFGNGDGWGDDFSDLGDEVDGEKAGTVVEKKRGGILDDSARNGAPSASTGAPETPVEKNPHEQAALRAAKLCLAFVREFIAQRRVVVPGAPGDVDLQRHRSSIHLDPEDKAEFESVIAPLLTDVLQVCEDPELSAEIAGVYVDAISSADAAAENDDGSGPSLQPLSHPIHAAGYQFSPTESFLAGSGSSETAFLLAGGEESEARRAKQQALLLVARDPDLAVLWFDACGLDPAWQFFFLAKTPWTASTPAKKSLLEAVARLRRESALKIGTEIETEFGTLWRWTSVCEGLEDLVRKPLDFGRLGAWGESSAGGRPRGLYRDSVVAAVRNRNSVLGGGTVSVEDAEAALDYFSSMPDFFGREFFLAAEELPKSDDEPLSPSHAAVVGGPGVEEERGRSFQTGREEGEEGRSTTNIQPENYAPPGSAAAEPDGWGEDDGWDDFSDAGSAKATPPAPGHAAAPPAPGFPAQQTALSASPPVPSSPEVEDDAGGWSDFGDDDAFADDAFDDAAAGPAAASSKASSAKETPVAPEPEKMIVPTTTADVVTVSKKSDALDSADDASSGKVQSSSLGNGHITKRSASPTDASKPGSRTGSQVGSKECQQSEGGVLSEQPAQAAASTPADSEKNRKVSLDDAWGDDWDDEEGAFEDEDVGAPKGVTHLQTVVEQTADPRKASLDKGDDFGDEDAFEDDEETRRRRILVEDAPSKDAEVNVKEPSPTTSKKSAAVPETEEDDAWMDEDDDNLFQDQELAVVPSTTSSAQPAQEEDVPVPKKLESLAQESEDPDAWFDDDEEVAGPGVAPERDMAPVPENVAPDSSRKSDSPGEQSEDRRPDAWFEEDADSGTAPRQVGQREDMDDAVMPVPPPAAIEQEKEAPAPEFPERPGEKKKLEDSPEQSEEDPDAWFDDSPDVGVAQPPPELPASATTTVLPPQSAVLIEPIEELPWLADGGQAEISPTGANIDALMESASWLGKSSSAEEPDEPEESRGSPSGSRAVSPARGSPVPSPPRSPVHSKHGEAVEEILLPPQWPVVVVPTGGAAEEKVVVSPELPVHPVAPTPALPAAGSPEGLGSSDRNSWLDDDDAFADSPIDRVKPSVSGPATFHPAQGEQEQPPSGVEVENEKSKSSSAPVDQSGTARGDREVEPSVPSPADPVQPPAEQRPRTPTEDWLDDEDPFADDSANQGPAPALSSAVVPSPVVEAAAPVVPSPVVEAAAPVVPSSVPSPVLPTQQSPPQQSSPEQLPPQQSPPQQSSPEQPPPQQSPPQQSSPEQPPPQQSPEPKLDSPPEASDDWGDEDDWFDDSPARGEVVAAPAFSGVEAGGASSPDVGKDFAPLPVAESDSPAPAFPAEPTISKRSEMDSHSLPPPAPGPADDDDDAWFDEDPPLVPIAAPASSSVTLAPAVPSSTTPQSSKGSPSNLSKAPPAGSPTSDDVDDWFDDDGPVAAPPAPPTLPIVSIAEAEARPPPAASPVSSDRPPVDDLLNQSVLDFGPETPRDSGLESPSGHEDGAGAPVSSLLDLLAGDALPAWVTSSANNDSEAGSVQNSVQNSPTPAASPTAGASPQTSKDTGSLFDLGKNFFAAAHAQVGAHVGAVYAAVEEGAKQLEKAADALPDEDDEDLFKDEEVTDRILADDDASPEKQWSPDKRLQFDADGGDEAVSDVIAAAAMKLGVLARVQTELTPLAELLDVLQQCEEFVLADGSFQTFRTELAKVLDSAERELHGTMDSGEIAADHDGIGGEKIFGRLQGPGGAVEQLFYNSLLPTAVEQEGSYLVCIALAHASEKVKTHFGLSASSVARRLCCSGGDLRTDVALDAVVARCSRSQILAMESVLNYLEDYDDFLVALRHCHDDLFPALKQQLNAKLDAGRLRFEGEQIRELEQGLFFRAIAIFAKQDFAVLYAGSADLSEAAIDRCLGREGAAEEDASVRKLAALLDQAPDSKLSKAVETYATGAVMQKPRDEIDALLIRAARAIDGRARMHSVRLIKQLPSSSASLGVGSSSYGGSAGVRGSIGATSGLASSGSLAGRSVDSDTFP